MRLGPPCHAWPPLSRRAPRSTLLTAGTARACLGKGKETAHSFHAVTAGGDAFSRRPPRTTDLPGQATIAPGLDALRWAGQCQEPGGAVPCGTTRPRSRRTSRGTALCNGTPRQGCARSPWRHAAWGQPGMGHAGGPVPWPPSPCAWPARSRSSAGRGAAAWGPAAAPRCGTATAAAPPAGAGTAPGPAELPPAGAVGGKGRIRHPTGGEQGQPCPRAQHHAPSPMHPHCCGSHLVPVTNLVTSSRAPTASQSCHPSPAPCLGPPRTARAPSPGG